MMRPNIDRRTGYIGIAIFILNAVVIPLYFIYDGPPPLWNILTRGLINIFSCVGVIAFAAGFQSMVTGVDSKNGFLGAFIGLIGLGYAILVLAAESIQIGSVWAHVEPIDPTVVGNGGEGALLIYGPIERVLCAVFLIASGVAIKTLMLPTWIGWFSYLAGLYQLAFVPTIFFMSSPTNFYSTNGWNIPIAGGVFLWWVLVVSISLVKNKI